MWDESCWRIVGVTEEFVECETKRSMYLIQCGCVGLKLEERRQGG